MRLFACGYCGNIHVPQSRGRRSYKKKKPAFTCSKCGRKNKPSLERPMKCS